MSTASFLSFQYGLSRKPTLKPVQPPSFSKESQRPSLSKAFQPNIEEMRRVFEKFDVNKDGKISQQEYKSALRVLGKGTADTEAATSFEAVDSDGDGFIDFKEFMEMYNNGGGAQQSEIESAFRVFDLDGNGKISAEELMEVLKRLGERHNLDACGKMLRAVDKNGDGLIDMDEFVSMMTHTMKLS